MQRRSLHSFFFAWRKVAPDQRARAIASVPCTAAISGVVSGRGDAARSTGDGIATLVGCRTYTLGCLGCQLTAARLASTLFVVSTDRNRLHRRLDQTKRNTEVMEPVLQFLFHDAPLQGSAERPTSVDASYR